MPLATVVTAGTRVQLDSTHWTAARLTIELVGTTATVYGGYVGGRNTGAGVSSSAYDFYLNSLNPSITLGMGETKADSVDVDGVWIDASANSTQVAFFGEQI